jgi:hypothetical protein
MMTNLHVATHVVLVCKVGARLVALTVLSRLLDACIKF